MSETSRSLVAGNVRASARSQRSVLDSDVADSYLADGLHWVSVLMRASIGSLFLVAGALKIPNGIAGTVNYYRSLFEGSLLPDVLVTGHASAILFVELALAFWLFSGWRLNLAWKVAGGVLISLAVGMIFAGQYGVVSDNYVYVFLSAAGLLTSGFDRWRLGSNA